MDYATTIKKCLTAMGLCMLFLGFTAQAQFGPLSVDFAKQNVICAGQSNGSILAVGRGGTPPYRYAWSTGFTDSDDLVDRGSSVKNLSAGTYRVTVTDATGTTAVQAIQITQPSQLTVSANVTAPTCNGTSSGSITINAAGGTTPYMLKIDGIGIVSQTTTGLAPGQYVIWVQDANFCTIDIIVEVPECVEEDDCPMVMAGNGGQIGPNQSLCGPGNDPAEIVSVARPVWAEPGETLEYGWLMNEIGDEDNPETWVRIPGANGPNYNPGPLRTTTLFRRCVRRPGCLWIESNTVTITVGTEAVADITSPYYLCSGTMIQFSTPTSGHFASYSWDLRGVPGAPRSFVYGANPRIMFRGGGGPGVIRLTVRNGNCVSVHEKRVFVTDSPQLCNSGLTADLGNGTDIQAKTKAVVSPNPFTGEVLLTLPNELKTDGQVEVYQADGKLLTTIMLAKGTMQERLNLTSYQPGMYFLKVVSDDGEVSVQRIVKQ